MAGGYPDVVAGGVCKLAIQAGTNRRELCRRFGIAPKTGYKWLQRYAAESSSGLEDRSRRPRRSPLRTAAEIEHRVIGLRREVRGCWGGASWHGGWSSGGLSWRRALSPASCAAMVCSTRLVRRRGPFSALSARRPTNCGRWITRALRVLERRTLHPRSFLDDPRVARWSSRPAPTNASRPCARC